jgi:hypothetical protein
VRQVVKELKVRGFEPIGLYWPATYSYSLGVLLIERIANGGDRGKLSRACRDFRERIIICAKFRPEPTKEGLSLRSEEGQRANGMSSSEKCTKRYTVLVGN